MNLRDCKVGDIVEVMWDTRPYQGTVLIKQSTTLLGWKTKDTAPICAWAMATRLATLDPTEQIACQGYHYGYWFHDSEEVRVLASILVVQRQSTPVSAGMACACCKNFNHYAESNLPDNKYGCYSCRSSGRIQ
jgi:hypothetical protein